MASSAKLTVNVFFAVDGVQPPQDALPPDLKSGDFAPFWILGEAVLRSDSDPERVFLPIADCVEEHFLLLSLSDQDFGAIHSWFNHPDPPISEADDCVFLCDSFSALLDKLEQTRLTNHLFSSWGI